MTRSTLGFSDLKIDVPSHVCLFYSDDAELRDRLGFLAKTLDDPNEVAVLFGKQERLDEILGYIVADHGRDTAADLAAGRIVLVNGAPDAVLQTRARDALLAYLAGIERALTPAPSHLVGTTLSLADICFAVELVMVRIERRSRPALEKLRSWSARAMTQ